ncbi:MAG: cation:proton antiporter [Clostridia bacterium]|nr:cation:proton antiporter [Clostridia bacterium]
MLAEFFASRGVSGAPLTILTLAVMLFFGFLAIRVTKILRLPNVTAYILTGILLGPYLLGLASEGFMEATGFLPDVALAFIAFGVGEYFRLNALKKSGPKVAVVTLTEALTASVLVFLLTYVFLGLPLPFSVVLAALAAATAPDSTMMTIRQTHARGDLVDTLLQVVALDDVVGLLAYSAAISIALASLTGVGVQAAAVLIPLAKNLGVILLGAVFGWILKLFLTRKHSTDNRLIISVGLLFFFCAVCSLLDVSPLLGCMAMGALYINLSGDESLFRQLNYFNPPILLLFFVRSGMGFRLDALVGSTSSLGSMPLIVIGVGYFLVRILGKYLGAWLGCLLTRRPAPTRRFLGLALIPQAGVAIGLAAMCSRILGPGIGGDLETVILSSSVLYEIIGPVSAKLALVFSGSCPKSLEEMTEAPAAPAEGPPLSRVEELALRIRKIREAQEAEATLPSRDEAAFTEAAYEEYEAAGRSHFRRFLNR